MTPITIGVSACLLGQEVRYDGGHKHDRYITDTLGRFFRFVPVCPEVGCGLPIPRESMRLEGDPATPRLIATKSRRDLTGQMLAYCDAKVVELEHDELRGFIFKKNSPSSGLYRVKVYQNGMPAKNGSGLFAAAFPAAAGGGGRAAERSRHPREFPGTGIQLSPLEEFSGRGAGSG